MEPLIEKDNLGLDKQIDKLRRISPIAWKHINIYGTYNFDKESKIKTDSLNEFIDREYFTQK